MTNDELRQQMDFIVNQQAQTVVNLQTLGEKHVQAEQRISNLEAGLINLANIVADSNKAWEVTRAELAEAQKRTELSIQELKAQTAETDERLNSFINFVERYLSDRQNGHSQN